MKLPYLLASHCLLVNVMSATQVEKKLKYNDMAFCKLPSKLREMKKKKSIFDSRLDLYYPNVPCSLYV